MLHPGFLLIRVQLEASYLASNADVLQLGDDMSQRGRRPYLLQDIILKHI